MILPLTKSVSYLLSTAVLLELSCKHKHQTRWHVAEWYGDFPGKVNYNVGCLMESSLDETRGSC